MSAIELRLGRYQDVLADVEMVDCVISDPPYGGRTHEGHDGACEQVVSVTGQRTRESIGYQSWTPEDVRAFVAAWAPRTRGWMACMTSHDLIPAYEAAYRAAGRYAFAPVGIIQKRPRLLGDGPASWLVYLCVARPRNVEFARWGCLDGIYTSHCDKTTKVTGAKPLELMRAIVRDYSREGDLVVDPCAGGGTTLLAARLEGRRAIGAEMDPTTYDLARRRLADLPLSTETQPSLFDRTP